MTDQPQTRPAEDGTFCPDCGGPLWLLDGVPRCGQCYEPEKDSMELEKQLSR
jgi:hypothetical protein